MIYLIYSTAKDFSLAPLFALQSIQQRTTQERFVKLFLCGEDKVGGTLSGFWLSNISWHNLIPLDQQAIA
jgi:hypothetical protein